MSLQLLEIGIVALITLITLTTELSNEPTKKGFFKKLNFMGWLVLILSVILIGINVKNYLQREIEKLNINDNEITSKVEIKAYSKTTIDSIVNDLPQFLHPQYSKIGNDNIIIKYEKTEPKPGRARTFESWYLYLYSTKDTKIEGYRLDTKNVLTANNKSFKLKMDKLENILCKYNNIESKVHIIIKGQEFQRWIGCNERWEVPLKFNLEE
jgi:hypothetical protein